MKEHLEIICNWLAAISIQLFSIAAILSLGTCQRAHADYICQGPCVPVVAAATATATVQPTPTAMPRVITFTESQAIIGNPGVGFQTTRETKAQVSNPRNIPLLHATFRTCMHQLNPSPGVFDWSEIDNFLTAANAQGQTVQLGVIAYDPYDCGGWLRNYVSSTAAYCSTENPSRTYYVPDWNNSTVQLRHRQFIEAFAAKYNNDPRVGSVDLRSMGDYGEHHHSCLKSRATNQPIPAPSDAARRAVVKDYYDFFTNKPLLHILDDFYPAAPVGRQEAIARGGGWRADCWGGHHEDSLYPQWLTNPVGMLTLWQRARVDLEPCGLLTSTSYMSLVRKIDEAIEKHASVINTKNDIAFSDAQWPEWQRLLRKLGYRIVVDSVTIDGQNLTIRLRNVGIAPNYRPIKIEAGSNSITVTRIMPNEPRIVALQATTPTQLKFSIDGRTVRTANNEWNGGLSVP